MTSPRVSHGDSINECWVVELRAPRDVNMRAERLDLSCLGDNAVAARTLYTAISPGTELAAYRGDPPLRSGTGYPRLMGYCNVAEIVARGTHVRDYAVGDRILTFQSHRSGFVCETSTVVAKLPSGANACHAAVTYLFQLGYNALLRGGFQPGHNVAVIGAGTLGLASVAVTAVAGSPAYAISNLESNLVLAREFGARAAFRKDAPELLEALDDATGRTGMDIVITTSNRWEDWRLALGVARHGGTICVLGFPGRGASIPAFNPLDPALVYEKQLTIAVCGRSPDRDVPPHDLRFTVQRNCRYLMDLVVDKRLPAERLISTVAEWTEIGRIYERLEARPAGMLTVALRW